MERIIVAAKIENLGDLFLAKSGHISADQVRSIDVNDALVDPEFPFLSMPKALIQRLGLNPSGMRKLRTKAGYVSVPLYDPVDLTVENRDCSTEVLEAPDDTQIRIGWIVLALLDLVVDVPAGKLIGNPAHGGEPMIELYRIERAPINGAMRSA